MYYIGICDDDPIFIKYIKRLVREMRVQAVFLEYHSGEELVSGMREQQAFDLFILDVKMPGMDGNETAKEFRKLFPDTLLVFCSGVCLPTVESFETTPYRYWLKQYTEERMRSELEGALSKLGEMRAAPCIVAKNGNQLVRLNPGQVSYIAIAKRGTDIFVADSGERYTSQKKLQEFYEQLKEFGFAYPHNSYIVNLKYVAAVGRKELEFVNGEKLSVSRARAKEFQKAFAVELAQKYGSGSGY